MEKDPLEEEYTLLCLSDDSSFCRDLEKILNDESNLSMRKASKTDISGLPSDVDCILLDRSKSDDEDLRPENLSVPVIEVLENGEAPGRPVSSMVADCVVKEDLMERTELFLARIRRVLTDRTLPSEEKVLERISDAFFALDNEWNFSYINERAEEILERDREELLGENLPEAFPGVEETYFQEKFEKASEKQEPVRFQQYFPPLGTWLRVHIFPSETGMSVYFRDITRSKSRIERLERQKEKLTAIDNINSVVQSISRSVVNQSTQREIEKNACKRLAESESYFAAWVRSERDGMRNGAGPEELLEDFRERASEGSSGDVGEDDVKVERFDEDELSMDIGPLKRVSVPLGNETDFYGDLVICSSRDNAFDSGEQEILLGLSKVISHAVTAVEREERYRTLVENLPNGAVMLFDRDLRFTMANGEIFEYYSLDPEDVLGKRIQDIEKLDRDVRESLGELFENVIDGEREERELELSGRNLQLYLIPIRGENGQVFSGMGLLMDITRRKRLEKDQEHRLKKFSEIVSHDLRNPLNVAHGYLDLAQKTGNEEDFAKVKKSLESIEGVVESLSLITRDQEDVEKVQVSLEDVFEEANDLSDQEIDYLVEDVEFRASRKELVRLLVNLISNSAEHNEGDVEVRAGPLENGFYVEDDGSGIDRPEKVFEYGYTGSDGEGLGLSIVKRISELNAWDVSVSESKEGGARFEFSF